MDIQVFSDGLADAVEHVGPSVVRVNGRSRQSASGIVWRADVVITAHHVIENEDSLTIHTADGTEHPAELVGRDPSHDLAILRIANGGLTAASFAQSAARVGQLVLAVGRPDSTGPQASLGLVNLIGGPVKTRRGTIDQYLRTDATPYPGFSGGPLIATNGEVVGLFTSGLASGEPVAIPVSIMQQVAEHLLNHGRIRRGYLGVTSQTIELPHNQRAGRSQDRGLLIIRVEEASPASDAGVLVGDILVGLDSETVTDPNQLFDLLSGDRVDKSVPVEVVRGHQLETLTVTISERP